MGCDGGRGLEILSKQKFEWKKLQVSGTSKSLLYSPEGSDLVQHPKGKLQNLNCWR